MVTLKVHAQKNWNAADLRNNGVNPTNGRHPDYIENFRRTLIGKRIGKNQDAVAVGALTFCVPLSKESPSC